MEGMCQRHGSNQNSHPPVLVRKPLCNQFIHYHISSRGVFGINHFQLRNFAVVAIECSFATVDRDSIMARIHRWSVMIYGSLQAEFMICRTLVGNTIVNHSDVVGASPVGTAPTTSSFSTQHLASMDWAKTTAWWDEKQLCCGIWCTLY